MRNALVTMASTLALGCTTYVVTVSTSAVRPNAWSRVQVNVSGSRNVGGDLCVQLTSRSGMLSCSGAVCVPPPLSSGSSGANEVYLPVPATGNQTASAYAGYYPGNGSDVLIAQLFEAGRCRPPIDAVEASASVLVSPSPSSW